jgi:hypothetical protein
MIITHTDYQQSIKVKKQSPHMRAFIYFIKQVLLILISALYDLPDHWCRH